MKRITIRLLLLCLLAISLAFVCSCSSTRKIASENTEQHIEATVNAEKHEQTQKTEQTQKSEAVSERTTETDFSTAVIEFTKIEYSDGTEEVNTSTGTSSESDAVFKTTQSTRTEPPDVGKSVKSITSGTVRLENNKTKQTDTNIETAEASALNEATQVDEAVTEDITEDTKTDVQITEKEKRGFFFYFGLITAMIAFLLFGLFLGHIIMKIIQNKYS